MSSKSKVHFYSPGKIYKPGDILTGYIEINLEDAETITGVCITIGGKAYISWNELTGGKNRNYFKVERYFKEKFNVVGNGNDSMELPAGQHIYPFKLMLPSKLPPSFCDQISIGKIIYKVKATLERSWKINKHIQEEFFVVSPTISEYPQIKETQIVSMEKSFGIFSKSRPLRVTVRAPCAFHTGQIIPLTIEVYNDSDTDVKSISVKLKQTHTFIANLSRKIYGITVCKNHIEEEIHSNESKVFSHTLTVPDDWQLFDLTNCEIIDLVYEIKIDLHTAGLTRNLTGILPLIPMIS